MSGEICRPIKNKDKKLKNILLNLNTIGLISAIATHRDQKHQFKVEKPCVVEKMLLKYNQCLGNFFTITVI